MTFLKTKTRKDKLEPVIFSARQARRFRGLTISEASQKLGVSEYTMSRIETGRTKISYSMALKLADLYQYPLSQFNFEQKYQKSH